MKLPRAYEWIEKVEGIPLTIRVAFGLHGVAEIVGKGSNATILSWRDELNQNGVNISGYSDDDIPWCGLFAAIVCFRRLGRGYEIPKNPLWARNWSTYGTPSIKPALGDVLVFSRGSGGHVGFYVAEDSGAYHVIGGNQSNKVCVTRIAKNRLIAARRPPYITQPEGVKPYRVAANGKLSTNEA